LGVGTLVHVVPFHLSASDVVIGGAVSEYPTAVQDAREVHDTPSRKVKVDTAAADAPGPKARAAAFTMSAEIRAARFRKPSSVSPLKTWHCRSRMTSPPL
jgi:hypothetical protein